MSKNPVIAIFEFGYYRHVFKDIAAFSTEPYGKKARAIKKQVKINLRKK